MADVLSLDWEQGSPATLSSLTDRQTVLDDAWAKSNDIEVGNLLKVRTPLERDEVYEVTGTVKDNADLLGNLVLTEEQLRTEFGVRQPSLTFVKARAGRRRRGGPGADQGRGEASASARSTRSISRS